MERNAKCRGCPAVRCCPEFSNIVSQARLPHDFEASIMARVRGVPAARDVLRTAQKCAITDWRIIEPVTGVFSNIASAYLLISLSKASDRMSNLSHPYSHSPYPHQM